MKKKTYLYTLLILLVVTFWQCKPTKTVTSNEDDNPTFFADEGCPDLILTKLQIVERNKKELIVNYTIQNTGDASVSVLGANERKKGDNLAIKMYFSSDAQLQRGDVLIGGDYLDNDALKNTDGRLRAGKTYKGQIKVPLKKQTSFTPYLILDVDAWQTVIECDETNNQTAIETTE